MMNSRGVYELPMITEVTGHKRPREFTVPSAAWSLPRSSPAYWRRHFSLWTHSLITIEVPGMRSSHSRDFYILQLFQFSFQFSICQFSALGLVQQIHGPGHSGVPLVHADLSPVLPLLQPVISAVILDLGRRAVPLVPRLFAMRPHLAAGAFGLAGSDVVAVAGVVSPGQQKILPAVVAAAGRVARDQWMRVSGDRYANGRGGSLTKNMAPASIGRPPPTTHTPRSSVRTTTSTGTNIISA